MNIHTSKCTFLPFLPEKSVKDIPFTASTFTNVQLYRRNKSNTTNLEQGLSNITTRHVLFTNATKNFTLINCTYTTCILQVLIFRKQRKPSLQASWVKRRAPDGPTGLGRSPSTPPKVEAKETTQSERKPKETN